jgi:hypothetical protein
LAGNRRLAAAAVEFLEVDVVYPENSSARGLLLSGASFNEGSLHYEVVTDPVTVAPARASRAAALRLSWDGAGLRFEVPGHTLASVEVLDIRGRRVATQRHAQPVAVGHLSRSGLPAGALILRVSGADGTWSQILPSIAP